MTIFSKILINLFSLIILFPFNRHNFKYNMKPLKQENLFRYEIIEENSSFQRLGKQLINSSSFKSKWHFSGTRQWKKQEIDMLDILLESYLVYTSLDQDALSPLQKTVNLIGNEKIKLKRDNNDNFNFIEGFEVLAEKIDSTYKINSNANYPAIKPSEEILSQKYFTSIFEDIFWKSSLLNKQTGKIWRGNKKFLMGSKNVVIDVDFVVKSYDSHSISVTSTGFFTDSILIIPSLNIPIKGSYSGVFKFNPTDELLNWGSIKIEVSGQTKISNQNVTTYLSDELTIERIIE